MTCASLLLTKKLGSSSYAVNGELIVALFNPSEGYCETSANVPWCLLTCPTPTAALPPAVGNRSCASLAMSKPLGSRNFAMNGELNVALFNPSEGYFEPFSPSRYPIMTLTREVTPSFTPPCCGRAVLLDGLSHFFSFIVFRSLAWFKRL